MEWPISVDAMVGEECTKDDGDKEHFSGERMRRILLNIKDGGRTESVRYGRGNNIVGEGYYADGSSSMWERDGK